MGNDGLGKSHMKMRWERTCISSRRPGGRMGGQCSRSPWVISSQTIANLAIYSQS